MIGKNKEIKSGITWRSVLAALYALFVFQPAFIWISLQAVIGRQMSWAIAWFSVILWIELIRLAGSQMTKQELTCVYVAALTSALNAGVALNALYALYFTNSPISLYFGLKTLPEWYAPPRETGLFWIRDFLHSAWFTPLLVGVLGSLIGNIIWMSMGMFAKEIFIEIEDLPFPMEMVTAEVIDTLIERDPERLSVFSISAALGIFYGSFLYAIPSICQSLGYLFQPIPAPWLDLNYHLEWFLPGASLGIGTDLLFISIGLVLSSNVVLSIFLGSFALYFIGNWISVTYGLYISPWWAPGLDVGKSFERSTLYLWANPIVGASIAAGLMPILLRPKVLIDAFKFRSGSSGKGLRRSPFILPFMIFLVGAILNITVVRWLVPDFSPLWLIIIIVPFSIINTLITARIYGLTGQRIETQTMLRNILLAVSGYEKPDIWLAPINIADGAGWAGLYKLGKVTQTGASDINKIFWIIWPVSILMSFLYVRAFWRMAPIPSAAYPGVEIFWPVSATYQCLWMTRAEGLFDPALILYGFLAVSGLSVIQHFLQLPISIGGIVAGTLTAIPYSISLMFGHIIGSILKHFKGKEWFRKNNYPLAAGLSAGEATAIIIGIAASLIIKSTWMLPF